MDDRRVVSGVVYVIKHGLQWKDAPDEYGPHKPLYNRFVRWSKIGIFNKIFNVITVCFSDFYAFFPLIGISIFSSNQLSL